MRQGFTITIAILPLWLFAAAANGGESASSAPAAASAPEPGEVTRLWLARQREGKQASPKAQPLSGPVQEQVYERYRKSFSHPIPEDFKRESLRAGGSSGSSSSR